MRLNNLGPVSVSRLQRFDRCPYGFFWHYVKHMKEPAGEPAQFGKLVHYMSQQAIHMNTDVKNNKDDFIIHIMSGESQWAKDDKEPKEMAQIWQSCTEKDHAIKMVERAVNLWTQLPIGKTHLEQYFKLQIPDTDVQIQGYIDLFQESGSNAVLWDWKTGSNVKGTLKSYQLALYAWALSQVMGIPVENIKRQYIFLGLDQELFTDHLSVERALEWVRKIIREINTAFEVAEVFGDEAAFPKRPGKPCRLCGFKNLCETQQGVAIPEVVNSQEQATEVAGLILELETKLDQAKKVLKDYCSQNGHIELNGEYFGLYPGSIKRDWDRIKLWEALHADQEICSQLLSIDARTMKTIIKKKPDLEALIQSALISEKIGNPTFKHATTPPKAS